VLVIGPGLGRECETVTLVHEIVKQCHLPMVIDADGLWAVGSNLRLLEDKQHVILTPNAPEFVRLLDSAKSQGIIDQSACSGEDLAAALKCTILIKGNNDKIYKGVAEQLSVTNNELGMPRRCGGQGDIVSGLSATFLHWALKAKVENPTVVATLAATTLMKRAAKLAYEIRGHSTLTTDILEHINCNLLLHSKSLK